MDTVRDTREVMLARATLEASEIERFERDGWLLVPGALDAAAVVAIDRWACEVAAMPEVPGRQWVYHEDSRARPGDRLINRIERISPFHDGFARLARALAGPAGQLLGDDAVLFKEKINFKMPGGDGFAPHQDSQAGWERYASYFVSVMLCIDEATIENGCLEVASGEHRRGMFREWEPLAEADMASMRFEPCPTAPGDLVLFDSYTPHRSEPNETTEMRRMYFATYNRRAEGDQLERYYADKRASYPPDIERAAGREYVYRV